MTDELCTVAQVKARSTPPILDINDDGLITDLIDEVSDWIEDFTGRAFVPEAGATYVVDTLAGSSIAVPRGIRAVTSLGIATVDQPDTGGTYAAATLFYLRPTPMTRPRGWPATEIRLPANVLATCANGAQIVGDFGFAAVPLRVRSVAIDAVLTAYLDRRAGGSGAIGAEGGAIFPWATYFSSGSPQRATLERFRVPGIA